MNTKKSKHKKPKSTNAVSTPSEISENLEDIKTKELINNEEIPSKEDLSNLLANALVVETENVCTENAPLKPKRKQGKKKKQEPTSDSMAVSESLNVEAGEPEPILLNETEKLQIHSERDNEVMVGRKKKKGKKKSKPTEEETMDKTESTPHVFVHTPETDNISTDVNNEAPIKKQKKKKHSDISELESCTSAFQKLLKPEDCPEETHLSDSSCGEGSTLDNTNKSNQSLGATSKKKKKHKKEKNKVIDLAGSNPASIVFEESIEEKPEFVTNEVTEDIKPKATIAKPVDKKRKSKHISSDIITEEKISNNSVPDIVNKTIVDENKEPKANLSIVVGDCIVDDVTAKTQIEENITLQTTSTEQSTEQNSEAIQSGNTKLIESRPSRKKKKMGKHTDKEKINETKIDKVLTKSDVKLTIQQSPQQSNLNEEESNITPDLIQYPRSSSQQQLNNNNIVIRELNSPEQEQLGIYILKPVPLIEGSGESPEIRPKQDLLNLDVKDVKTGMSINIDNNYEQPQKIEHTTQHNTQEMEDLKRSIEKSLAELTELEKKNLEAEKEFTEVLEYNVRHSNELQEEEMKKKACETKQEKSEETMVEEFKSPPSCAPPVCPARKSKRSKTKKGKKPPEDSATTSSGISVCGSDSNKSEKKEKQETSKNDNQDKNSDKQDNKGKQQSAKQDKNVEDTVPLQAVYEPIEKFEDALTSSTEDVNDTFEMIAKEASELLIHHKFLQKPEISVTEPDEETKTKPAKVNPILQPKNLLGHPKIPVQSNKTDYKKEKNKPPNTMSAKAKIRDVNEIEKVQTKVPETKPLKKASTESCTYKTNANDDFVYKYSFRKVFLPNVCHVCMKELGPRVPCTFCNLFFYCSQKHKDEDWPQHQFLCFVVCTLAHLKDQKFIYGDAKNVTGQEYRVLRMQVIISCEKMLKRKLVAWEQESLLYPRICNNSACREWRQGLLTDCQGCGQVSYCKEYPDHLPMSHQNWCKSYALYQKLVYHQQKLGRLEPMLPTKPKFGCYLIPKTMNEVLTSLYEETLDMNDVDYAALTQIATAPLTAAYCYQTSRKNGLNKTTFTIHIVGAELQFEADVLNKWEIFFLHLRPDVKDLRVVLISRDLNPSNLPLDLISKIKLCEDCGLRNRRLLLKFVDKKSYQDFYNSDEFLKPDIVCSFNQSIERASVYNGKDHWPTTIKCISKLKSPLLITSYTLNELTRDINRVNKLSNFNVICEPKHNSFASVRPDRNFITDDEMPLLFKNYCYTVVCG